MKEVLRLTMLDNSQWDIPIEAIALNRAEHYADEFDGDIQKSLTEDTNPYFADNDWHITDWAVSNMNWEDVEEYAVEAIPPPKLTKKMKQQSWLNGEMKILKTP